MRLVPVAADAGIHLQRHVEVRGALHELDDLVAHRDNGFDGHLRLAQGRDQRVRIGIAGHRLLPELIQGEATAANLAAEAYELLSDSARRRQIVEGLAEVRRRLDGEAGSSCSWCDRKIRPGDGSIVDGAVMVCSIFIASRIIRASP